MTVERWCALLVYVSIGSLLILGRIPRAALAQGPELPLVTAASVPLYPRVALLAHIQGTVKVRAATDGKAISSIDVESGPPMLVRATEENIRTWRFEEHKPTTLLVTFEYRIEEPAGCRVDNGAVVLHMPQNVEISARGVHTCDPAEEK